MEMHFAPAAEPGKDNGGLIVNIYMNIQITNMLTSLRIFDDAIKLAARKDDGEINKEEQRQLQQIAKATAQYRAELERIKKGG